MTCASLVSPPMVPWVQAPERSTHYAVATRHVAVLLFDGCSFPGAVILAEVFHAANELASHAKRNWTYEICFVSATGGNVRCSSSVHVWTDGLDEPNCLGFDALFVADGVGAREAARDERLIAWLRRAHANMTTVRPIGEGRSLLEAADINGHTPQREFGSYNVAEKDDDIGGSEANDRLQSMKSALMLIKRDLGIDVARGVAERLLPDTGASLASLLGETPGTGYVDKMHVAARWLKENCPRSISVIDAARAADMSARNFQRRFKAVVGVTPSDYLLHARFAIVCSLLTHSELPIDKIARRTGMGNGDRLAKIFRRRMNVSPTEYRMKIRREAGI